MNRKEKLSKKHKCVNLNPETLKWYAQLASARKTSARAVLEFALEKLCADNNQDFFNALQ